MEFILASSSPRRKEILKNAGYNFKIIPSCYDEKLCNKKYSKELIENCAYQKALDVFKKNNSDIIVAADTVVVLNDIILGKPKDEKEAFLMLKRLCDKTHFVQTSICIMSDKKYILDSEITYVKFKKMPDERILNYINTQKPFDKAGSYGIQDDGFDFVLSIEGEINNVIGFPITLFKKYIKIF